MNLNDLLKVTFEKKASDLHVKVGVPPILRIDGKLTPLESEKRLTQEDSLNIAQGIMNPAQKAKFMERNELDMAYLELTEEGKAIFPALRTSATTVVNRFFGAFNASELGQFEALLEKMLAGR